MEILDSSALICFLKKEKGYGEIANLLRKSRQDKQSVFISQLNFIEVVYFLLRTFGSTRTKEIVAQLKSPYLGIVNYMDADLALYSATLKSTFSLSLGDAIGLAFTKIMNGKFWTKDKALVPVAEKEKIDLCLIK